MLASFSTRKSVSFFAIACAVSFLDLTATALADAPSRDLDSAQAHFAIHKTAEPFGLMTSALPDGPLQTKWRDVERAIENDVETISRCRGDRASCSSPSALQFLRIVDAASVETGLARIGEINRAFNLAIRPVSDLTQYGVDDLWTSPLATLASGAGDCEDYAIAKLVALREAGLSADDLRLVILREASGEDHAVVAVRTEGRWRMLDNRILPMIVDSDIKKYQPVFAIDAEGAKRYWQPSIAIASATAFAPATSATALIEPPDEGLTTSAINPASVAPIVNDLWLTNAM